MEPLVDQFDRIHTSLRISVTDRCNIRCFYCMPDESIQFRPREELLDFEEIQRFVRVLATTGISKLRLTGGEPLLRRGLPELIRQLKNIQGIQDVAITTNGILLADCARELKASGLDRLNISLDTLQEETFQKIARRPGLDKVLMGIDAAKTAGFSNVRLNAIAMRGITESEILPLARFARQNKLELRFIEFMPLDAEQNWSEDGVLSGGKIRDILESEFGPLEPAVRQDISQPAVDYGYTDIDTRVGFVNSVTKPFCETCNRLRITAEGQVRNCLFSDAEWDARKILRSGGSDDELIALVRECVNAKKRGHGRDTLEFARPTRAMYQIGG